MAKREIIKETNIVDEASDRLDEARLRLAKTVMAAEFEMELHPTLNVGFLEEIPDAEDAFIDAYFKYGDALEKEDEAEPPTKATANAPEVVVRSPAEEQLRSKLQDLSSRGNGVRDVLTVLREFSYERISDVKPEHYEAIVAKVDELLGRSH